MRIKEFPQTQLLQDSDMFLTDNENGTKSVSFLTMTLATINKFLNQDVRFKILDATIPFETRRNTWRGKNLGDHVTDEQYERIGDGTFKGLFLGDYWVIEDRVWRIMDFDYWFGTGDVKCETHHLVIMPDETLYQARMNATDTTAGGYVGSEMYKTGLNQAKSIVNEAFGEEHVLVHRECLINTVVNGYPSNTGWFDSTVELPNEIMMYGSYIFTPAGNETVFVNRATASKALLSGMKVSSNLINPHREPLWLRDVYSASRFSTISKNNVPSVGNASTATNKVRPVFGICQQNQNNE